VCLLAACLSLLAFKLLMSPWAAILSIWAIVFLCAAIFTRNTWAKIIFSNVAAAIIAVGAAELWFFIETEQQPVERFEGRFTEDYFTEHSVLGYGPLADREVPVRRFVDDQLIYDTNYTINSSGLRITSLEVDRTVQQAVLFFGGSVTFGEGVPDKASMPFQADLALGDTYRVYNFGFHGYGPHQMLAALDSGLVEDLVDKPVSDVIYQAIPAHIARVIGLAHWDPNGPQYDMGARGNLEHLGSFAENRNSFFNWSLPYLRRSLVFEKVFGSQRALTQADVDLYIGVVAASRDHALRLYPNSRFHILLWGFEGEPMFDAMVAGFKNTEQDVHRIADILPEYYYSPELYVIGEHDAHPNPMAHKLIADYVARQLIRGGADH
jgi:hypothetical protein